MNKLAAMILVITKGKEVGRTTLNMLLYFADISHFLSYGKSISGETYRCLQYGPVPNEVDIARRILINRGYLRESVKDYDIYRAFAYEANVEEIDFDAVRAEFHASELETIDATIAELRPMSGSDLSRISHEFEPWKSAYPNDELVFGVAHQDAALHEWLKAHRLM